MSDANSVRLRLLTLEKVREELARTEPLEELFTLQPGTRFFLGHSWNHGIKSIEGTDIVSASIALRGKEYQLTKDALLQLAAAVGLYKPYVMKTPAKFIEEQLNYWYDMGFAKAPNLLVCRNIGVAAARKTAMPFSNLEILDSVETAIRSRFGKNIEILVDYKFHHSLRLTSIRLIFPEIGRNISTNLGDDFWSAGVSISNSLVVELKEKTILEGYCFKWSSSGGLIDNRASTGPWSRKHTLAQSQEAVNAWAETEVDKILDFLEYSFDSIQSLTNKELSSETIPILRDVFRTPAIRTLDKKAVVDSVLGMRVHNMYDVLAQMIEVADSDRDDRSRRAMMRAAGELPHIAGSRCPSCHHALN